MQPLNTLLVHGTKRENADGSITYTLEPGNRDVDNQYEIDLTANDDLLELTLDDELGTQWIVDKNSIYELFPEVDPEIPGYLDRGDQRGTFTLPEAMEGPASERGHVGKIALKLLTLFAKKDVVKSSVTKLAEVLDVRQLLTNLPEDENSGIRKALETRNFIKEGGELFKVSPNFEFEIFDANEEKEMSDYDPDAPYFIFIHGTFSNTLGSFSDLKGSIVWNTLFENYPNKVLAFQHRTLTHSPLQNAIRLAELLPDRAIVHILSHSRGGLIGDIINRYSEENNNARGFREKHINLLKEEGRSDWKLLGELEKIYTEKVVTVQKFIRVACPAAGTKLASRRLDHVLNAFLNLLPGVTGDILSELVMTAVTSKSDVNVLPGLEAQIPDSPFIRVLNDPSEEAAIGGKALAVVSGNGIASFSGKGLLIILGKLFYWRRNDLVVNTDSMYLGAKRQESIQYFFDQGKSVSHFHYFLNKSTLDAIDLAMKAAQGASIPGFKSVDQYEVPKEDRAIEYGELVPDDSLPTWERPIVVLLPGIMGSNLTKNNKELWLHYGRMVIGGLKEIRYNPVNKIEATSIVKSSYDKLVTWLSYKYDVIIFPFDWRIPIRECADEFNTRMEALLDMASKKNQPIKIIGHSMGGVLVRDFIINHDSTWRKLNDMEGFRLIYLGSPLGGSHRILTVLFGRDDIINKVSKLDLIHTKKGLLRIFRKFPGILGLLPLTSEEEEDYANIQLWERLRTYMGDEAWPLPSAKDLDDFRKYRSQVNSWFQDASVDYSNMVYIAGLDSQTPVGYYLKDFQPEDKKELGFIYTREGDQSVSWKLGIPQRMRDNNSVYYTEISHGALANSPEIFEGIEEILSTGKTKFLRQVPPPLIDREKVFRGEPDIDFDMSEQGFLNTILGLKTADRFKVSQIPLSVTVVQGDLRYAKYPILAGHFQNDEILYAEKAIDVNLRKVLSDKHALGLYPGEIGTNYFFRSPKESDFKGAIIVGMGEPEFLTSQELSRSVEQGVLNYLIELSGSGEEFEKIGISSLLMANGYGGLTIESSMKAIITGINQANIKIRELDRNIYHTVDHLEFIERYSDRALNCMYSLNSIVKTENDNYNIVIASSQIITKYGVWKRIPMDASAEWWNRITVKFHPGSQETSEIPSLIFGASTSSSRQEVGRVFSSTPLIDLFIAKASTKNNWNEDIARTLFQLLIPNEMKERLGRKGNLSWILDTDTASYPWELLQDNSLNAKPLCIHTGMIRQLSTSDYRKEIKRVATQRALVIADPVLGGFIGQLRGARQEGHEVAENLSNYYSTTALIESDAATITKNFFSKNYSIIHLAGHGIFNEKSPDQSGMVIGNKLYISVFHIKQLPVVPEFVFVNCCHLGAVNDEHEKYYRDRYKLAANIGTQLISIGVKAVIAAGWVVNDGAALDFAREFYKQMLAGDNFGDAVRKARSCIYDRYPGYNTWGAYQCYGDPFFRFSTSTSEDSDRYFIVPEEAEIALDNTMNHIQMGLGDTEGYLNELAKIDAALARDELTLLTNRVIERQAQIYYQLALYEKAIEKFDLLRQKENADFSLSALTTSCNARAKWEVQSLYLDGIDLSTVARQKAFDKARSQAYGRVQEVIAELGLLLRVGETADRMNMLASAFKRLSMLATNRESVLHAMEKAVIYYKASYDNFPKAGRIYPVTNAIQISAILDLSKQYKGRRLSINFEAGQYIPNSKSGKGKWKNPMKWKLYTLAEAEEILNREKKEWESRAGQSAMNYWKMLAGINIDMSLLMVRHNNLREDAEWQSLESSFKRVWNLAGSEGNKLLELEHLKILIYALSMAAGTSWNILPHRGEATLENLSVHISALRTALTTLRQAR